MEIAFASKKLKRTLSSARSMQMKYGDLSKRIRLRLDGLRAAQTLAEVSRKRPTRRHELVGDWAGCFAVDLSGNWRLIFRPTDPSADDEVDPSTVKAITIVDIVDYH